MSSKISFGPGPSMPFLPGTMVSGRYSLQRALARGPMGFVVQAHDRKHNRGVALKFMHAWIASELPEGAARFLVEARTAARIRSDHVVRVFDAGTFQGSPYLVMEHLDGEDLEAFLRRQPMLRVPTAVTFAVQASEGLAEAHALGIVHRDLKPTNVFLARRGEASRRVKLLDVGISTMIGSLDEPPGAAAGPGQAADAGASTYGSPLYMAPERMLSAANADPRSDIWSLGVILYEMLAGVRPFAGETLAEICARILDPRPRSVREIRPEVPTALEAAVMQCLQRNPDHRFRDVAAFVQALANSGPGTSGSVVAKIRQIVHGPATPPSPEAPPDVPDCSLTDTSFNRAVDGVAHLMRVQGVTIRYEDGPEVPPVVVPPTPVPPPPPPEPESLVAAPASESVAASPWRVRLERLALDRGRAVLGKRSSKLALLAASGGLAIATVLFVVHAAHSEKPGRAETQTAAALAPAATLPPWPPAVASVAPPGSFDAPIDVSALPTATASTPRMVRAPLPRSSPRRASGSPPAPKPAPADPPVGTAGFGGRE